MTRFPLGSSILRPFWRAPTLRGRGSGRNPSADSSATASQSENLVFEREVFNYPRYERRNPFAPLLSGDEAGPRFEGSSCSVIISSRRTRPDRWPFSGRRVE